MAQTTARKAIRVLVDEGLAEIVTGCGNLRRQALTGARAPAVRQERVSRWGMLGDAGG